MGTDTKSLIGKKIRMLTVLKFSHIEKVQHKDRLRNKYMYECRCDCGTITTVNGAHLKQKDGPSATWSCGCLQKQRVLAGHKKQRGIPRPNMQKPNGASVLHTRFLVTKKSAETRNLCFELTELEFEKIVTQNCFYCGDAPSLKRKNKKDLVSKAMHGVDRVDSTKGYTIANSQSCCKWCNYAKHQMTLEQWKEHTIKLAKNMNWL